jgi:hypothetical protein
MKSTSPHKNHPKVAEHITKETQRKPQTQQCNCWASFFRGSTFLYTKNLRFFVYKKVKFPNFQEASSASQRGSAWP